MTLDNHDLQRLVGLYRQVATANAEIAALYAEKLELQTAPKAVASTAKKKPAAATAPKAAVKQKQPQGEVVAVSVEQLPVEDPNKPAPQRVAVEGFDMSKLGMTKSDSSVVWEVLIGHPPFHMFMSEQKFPNPDAKDDMELAVDFIMEQSKTKAELQFYAEYAKWFNAKGFWPDETPLGKPLPAKE